MADRDLRHTTLDLPVLTERLCLRTYCADDLENVFRLRSNPEVVAMLYGDPMTRKEAPEVLARYMTPPVLEVDGDESVSGMLVTRGHWYPHCGLHHRAHRHPQHRHLHHHRSTHGCIPHTQ